MDTAVQQRAEEFESFTDAIKMQKTETSPADDFSDQSFFHAANNICDVHSIRQTGFRSDWVDEEGRWFRDGNLGVGTYLTRNWKTALLFGTVLMRVTLERGTRIIDTSIAPDQKVLDSLKREFGSEVLTATDVRKVIPKRKKLTEHELVEITRHHYNKLWERDWGTDKDGYLRWPQKRERHTQALRSCTSLLRQYGFHGYGNPQDDNGIVIFSSDRVVPEEVLADIPFHLHADLLLEQNIETTALEDLKQKYPSTFTFRSSE